MVSPLHTPGSKKYIVFRREIIELTYDGPPYFWRDEHACIWGFAETSSSVDNNSGCGVGILKWYSWLPWAKKLNRACKPHDFIYSCPAWQAFHTRYEADSYLKYLIKVGAEGDGSHLLAQAFKQLSREFGDALWENKETND